MAMKILEECIVCGACEPECPNEAIAHQVPTEEAPDLADIYLVDAARCTECVGAYDDPRCVAVCPIDGCIVVDAALAESREALQDKYNRLHA